MWGLCGVLVFDSVSRLLRVRLLLRRLHLSHTTFIHTQLCQPPSLTHNFLSHTIFHIQLSFTHNFVTHHLSHTTSSHIIFHIQLYTTVTYNFVTPSFTYNCFAWQAWRLATSAFLSCGALRGRRGTWRHLPSFHVAGVALGDTCLRFVGQSWHLWHWAGSGGALGLVLVAGDAAALCVAGVGTW